LPYVWQDLSKAEMKKLVESTGNTYNKELTDHMKKLFGDYMKDGFKDKLKEVLQLPKRVFDKVFG